MWRTKACPRCRGDLYKSNEDWGNVYTCLQCGHDVWDQSPKPEFTRDQIRRLLFGMEAQDKAA